MPPVVCLRGLLLYTELSCPSETSVKTPNFTLRQLNYFATAARLGKISTAAAELGISQSAITTAILDLESLLGVTLLDRHPGGVTPTYRGQMFLAHADNILAAAHDAQRSPFRAGADVQGTLRLSASYVVAGYFLLPILAKFRSVCPNVQIDLSEMVRLDCEKALIDGRTDLSVLLTSNLENSGPIECARLLRSRRQLWVAANSPLLAQKEVSLRDIAQTPYVFLNVDDGEKVTRSYWQQHGLEPNVQFRTSSMEAMREWIALGMGVTVVADIVYRPWSLDGRKIERIPMVEGVPSMEIGVAWKRGAELSPAASAFLDFVTQAAGRVEGLE